ncbi:MAG TPA: peptidoglycan DD-metalloendopeptidase family protein, partial [Propionibacterium sp.]|nr:peptidoglycan DD-metalloendopeptidase family protein [Propionibacterium sp.]
MHSATGAPPPFVTRRQGRRRPGMLLAVLTASSCLSIPLAGMAAAQVTADPPVTRTSSTTPAATPLRATSAMMWDDPALITSRTSVRTGQPVDSWDALVLSPTSVTSHATGEIPLTNLDLPLAGTALVAGTTLGDPAALFASPYVSPVPGPITSPYGPRFHPILHYVRNHNGVDMTAACGTPIVAMTDGIVTRSGSAGGYGLLVEIDHGTVDEDRMSSRYAHLSVLGVNVGQKVSKGQQIGLAGTTGLSTGCHLHFEVLINGSFADPRAVLSGAPFVRLDTPMVPWTPGTKPTRPLPTVPRTESGPLPDLDEVPLVPAKPTPGPSSEAPDATEGEPVETPDPSVTDPRDTPPPVPVPVDPSPTPEPDPTPTPSPEPTPSAPAPTPEPTP